LAQDDEIKAVGSGIVEPPLRALVTASESEANINIEVTGTNTGFEQFCTGEADLTTATRPIASDEANACAENEITPLELVIGQDILAFIVNPDVEGAVCLTADELSTIYAPSAEGEITNWNQVLVDGAELDLQVFAPDEFTAAFALLDSMIEGAGIRNDATVTDDPVAVVSENSGAIGVASLPQAQAAGNNVRMLELDAAEIQGCQAPSAEAAEDELYPAATRLYLYVNTASLSKAGLEDFLTFVNSDDANTVIATEGFVPPTDVLAQANQAALDAAVAGELTVLAPSSFTIPVGVGGQVNVGGAAEGFSFIQDSTTGFNAVAPNATININIEGVPAGIRRLCNGETDIAYSYRDLTADEATNCEANTIETMTINVGSQAVVLLANAQTEYLSCLTTEQIGAIWRAESTDSILSWSQVSDAFPDESVTLFSPNAGSQDIDLLLLEATGENLIGRIDIELDDDPLYRAAATANVDGALTFMNWIDYQDVLENDQANIQLVEVDGGDGCVQPTLSTIRGGDYILARTGWFIVNKSQLALPAVQSFLWYAFSEDNIRTFQISGFIGTRLSDLADTRSVLNEAFNEAVIAQIQASQAEATEEPEATAEATEEAAE
jgi:phosphate transport system substrate-binding protein